MLDQEAVSSKIGTAQLTLELGVVAVVHVALRPRAPAQEALLVRRLQRSKAAPTSAPPLSVQR